MRRDGLELPEVLKCVDSFAEIYVRVVRRWIVKGKYDTSTLVFSLGKSPYIFPPEIIYEENGKQKKLLNFELPYKKEEERSADSDISDINMYIGCRPEFLEPIQKRFGEHLLEISEKSVLDLERPKEKEHMKLTMQGFYKEMDYYRTSLSIYDNIREKGNREEEKICNYLNEGVMLIQTPVRVRDVVNRENGVIGNFGLRTDGVWMWPAELSYYVQVYHLKLDEKFVETMRMNNWHVSKELKINYSEIEFVDPKYQGIKKVN